jgi:hypothetical protein|tara:strand:- start:581 stop:1012 length:432 start_codon:yes stop_codon:yes gene_type:complete
MAITQAMCSSFKTELLTGTHNFTNSSGNAFKMALYTSDATINAATTAYVSGNEVSSTNYTAKGGALTNITPSNGSGTVAFTSFSTLTFSTVTFTARGGLIHNTSQSDKAVCALDFGSNKTSTAGNFTITFPTNDASTAVIRIV